MQENTDWLINRENSIGNSKDIYVRGKKVSKVMEDKNKISKLEDYEKDYIISLLELEKQNKRISEKSSIITKAINKMQEKIKNI